MENDYGLKEASEISGVCIKTLRRYIKAGLLPTAWKFRGKKWFVKMSDIIRVKEGKVETDGYLRKIH